MRHFLLVFSSLTMLIVIAQPAHSVELFNRQSKDSEVKEPGDDIRPRNRPKPPETAAPENTEDSAQNNTNNQQKPPELSTEDQEKVQILQIHLKDLAQKCPNTWTSQKCLAALAESNKTLISVYAGDLDENGFKDQLTPLKEHCAASTAASKIEVPAYAMKSAMTECANTIYDISEATQVKPFLSHYQVLVTSIFCLSDDPRCAPLENTLLKIR
tara:strand:- start:90 stop:731 length:642 start_codon:yes stop_codon:yes gene_type:complete